MKPHIRILTQTRDRLRLSLHSALTRVEDAKTELQQAKAEAEKTQADLDDIEAFLKRQPD